VGNRLVSLRDNQLDNRDKDNRAEASQRVNRLDNQRADNRDRDNHRAGNSRKVLHRNCRIKAIDRVIVRAAAGSQPADFLRDSRLDRAVSKAEPANRVASNAEANLDNKVVSLETADNSVAVNHLAVSPEEIWATREIVSETIVLLQRRCKFKFTQETPR
jgi:hypothetical protein